MRRYDNHARTAHQTRNEEGSREGTREPSSRSGTAARASVRKPRVRHAAVNVLQPARGMKV